MNTNIENMAYYDEDIPTFKTTCRCGSDNHSIIFSVDYSGWSGKDIKIEEPYYSLEFFTKVRGPAPWGNSNCWVDIWRRIKNAFIVLFKGEITYEEEFIFRHGAHVRDFINTIQEQLDKAEFWKKDTEKQNKIINSKEEMKDE